MIPGPPIVSSDLPDGLEQFRPASPDLISARRLQQRIDRKYLLSRQQIEPLFARLGADYAVVQAAGRLAASYDSLYFDTADRQMYEAHRRDRGRRYKVRVRHHLDRQLSFLEVKRKDSDIRTTKARLVRPFGDASLDEEAALFIGQHSPLPAASLLPQVSIAFRRVTLVGAAVNERLTIDWDLEVRNDHRREAFAGIAIAEVKQARYSNGTLAVAALRALGVRERSVSKYCLATVTLSGVRSNTFKPVLRAVEQLSA